MPSTWAYANLLMEYVYNIIINSCFKIVLLTTVVIRIVDMYLYFDETYIDCERYLQIT